MQLTFKLASGEEVVINIEPDGEARAIVHACFQPMTVTLMPDCEAFSPHRADCEGVIAGHEVAYNGFLGHRRGDRVVLCEVHRKWAVDQRYV